MIEKEKVLSGFDHAKASQKRNYDMKAHVLPSLKPGEMVHLRLPGKQNWSLGTCTKHVGPRSYEVLCEDRKYIRNRRDLRKTPEYQSDLTKIQLPTHMPTPSNKGQLKTRKEASSAPACGVPSTEDIDQSKLRRSTRARKSPERYQA